MHRDKPEIQTQILANTVAKLEKDFQSIYIQRRENFEIN